MPEDVVLLMEGGGALGAYHSGMFNALVPYLESGACRLAGVVGASIGAVSAAVIAPYLREPRQAAAVLEAFWRTQLAQPSYPFVPSLQPYWQRYNGLLTGLLSGNGALFRPWPPGWTPLYLLAPALHPLYDPSPLKRTLEAHMGEYASDDTAPWLAIQAVEVASGQPVLFSSTEAPVRPEHVVASASIPLLFAPREVDGAYYWDGTFSPESLLLPTLRLLARQRQARRGERCRVLHVGLYGRASRVPMTLSDHVWRLKSLILGGKLEDDWAYSELGNRFLDFIEAVRRTSASDARLRRALEPELDALTGHNLAQVEITPVVRGELPHDPIASIFDFSPGRVDALIRQGEAEAAPVFAEQLPAPRPRALVSGGLG